MTEIQELYCNECNKYCRFPTDTNMNGNITVICRNCGHEHKRRVEHGVVTSDRWGTARRASAPQTIRSMIADKDAHNTIKSTKDGQGGNFLRQSWMNKTN